VGGRRVWSAHERAVAWWLDPRHPASSEAVRLERAVARQSVLGDEPLAPRWRFEKTAASPTREVRPRTPNDEPSRSTPGVAI
jgi:hypothetical protein